MALLGQPEESSEKNAEIRRHVNARELVRKC